MLKFIHTADVHFGVENYGRIDPKTGLHTRLLDFANSFARCVDAALEHEVDFFVLAGDAYKTANPTPTQQKLLLKQLFRLQQAGIPAVIVVGNHDHPLSFGKAHALDVYADLPVEGFYVFDKPEAKTIQTKSGPVQIVGIPWPSRQHILSQAAHLYKSNTQITEKIAESVVYMINKMAVQLDPAVPAVLTSHLTVSNGVFSGSEKKAVFGSDPLFHPEQLAIEPFNYVALGHLHRHQNLNPHGVPVVYAGSTERIDFGEVRDTKGFCLVSIETKKVRGQVERSGSYEFIKLPCRPMVDIKVKLNGKTDFTQQILQAIKQEHVKDSITKLIYQLPPGAKDLVDLPQVLQELKPAWHIAGIYPQHPQQTRAVRMKVSSEESDEKLLEKYLNLKVTNQDEATQLLELGKQLMQKAGESLT